MRIEIKIAKPDKDLMFIYGRDFRMWFKRAKALRDSARSVLDGIIAEVGINPSDLGEGPMPSGPAYERYRVYLMLMGYAFESLFKGILAMSLKDGERFKKAWFGHDLNKLAKLAGVNTEKGIFIFLDMMTAATVWVGKYPLAKDEQQYKDQSAELVFITGRSVWPYRISEVVDAFWVQTYEGAVGAIPIPPVV